MTTKRAVTRAAGIMMAAILMSRILGLVRESVITGFFGQGNRTDAYFGAFNVPDLLFYLIAGGVLSSAFIPVFVEYLTSGRRDDAWRVFNVVMTTMAIVVAVFIILGEIFTRQLVPVLSGGGFSREQVERITPIARIILPAQFCFFLGALFMASQWAHQRFLIPGLGPSIYNIGIICGGVIAGIKLGPNAVEGLAWGGLAGAFAGNFLLQGAMIPRLGGRFRFSLDVRHPGAMRVWRLMVPVIFSLSLTHVDVWINRWFCSYLFEGAYSALTRADRLMQLPIGMFGQAVGIGFYPTLSALITAGDIGEFRRTINYGLRLLMFVSIPSMVLMIVLGTPIIRLLFQHGRFTAQNTHDVYTVLVAYSLGIYFWCAQAVVARGFFSMQDTKTPVYVGTAATAVFVPLNWILMVLFSRIDPRLGHVGLALATTVSAGLHVGVLLVILRNRVAGLGARQLLDTAGKVLLASVLAGAAAYVGMRAATMLPTTHAGVKIAAGTEFAIGAGLGSLVFIAAVRVLKLEEAAAAWEMIKRRFSRKVSTPDDAGL